MDQEFKKYFEAIYSLDVDTMVSMIYEEDKREYRDLMIEFAEKMDVFGETADFLKALKIKNIDALKQLSVDDFAKQILSLGIKKAGAKELQKIIKGIRITNIDEAEVLTIVSVSYEMPIIDYDEWQNYKRDVSMIYSKGQWKLLMEAGMRMKLQKYQNMADAYQERKAKDQIDKLEADDDLDSFTLTGYKNEDGEIIIEPRFRDAGEFCEGFAYVQITRKYGYIDRTGELVIKPQFYKAENFSEGLAAVRINMEEEEQRWGFINQQGELVIPFQFKFTSVFSEGLCAVQKEGKWGYINKEGILIIPCKYAEANDFENGFAEVEFSKDNEFLFITIDKEGKWVD